MGPGPPTPRNTAPVGASPSEDSRQGVLYGVAAYVIWGSFPLYFTALRPAGPWEILAHRIWWTLLVCVLVLLARRDWRWVRPVLRRPKLMVGISIAAGLIATNWVVYVAAVISGHVTDASLGYFLNPIVTVALGVIVLRERLRPLQWLAVGVAFGAAVFLGVAAGAVPVIALTLATTFGLYGLTKKRIGAILPALHGLTLETAALVPVAAVLVGYVVASGTATFSPGRAPAHTALLASVGVATAVPLLLFAAAARRVPLVTIGLLQFITPVLQLGVGVLVLGEHMTPMRWAGFGIVWVALAILGVDSLLAAPRRVGPGSAGSGSHGGRGPSPSEVRQGPITESVPARPSAEVGQSPLIPGE